MKNIKLSILGAFVMSMFMLTSCGDECSDVTCLNGGTCLEGVCECPTGYEGDDCGEAVNAKFSGSYTQSSSVCDSVILGASTLVVTSSSTDPTEITIGGLYENAAGVTVTADVSSSNSRNFTIEPQVFNDPFFTDNLQLSGSGSVSEDGNMITVTYDIENLTSGDTNWESCTDSYTK